MGEATPASAVVFEQDDIELIKLFLSQYENAEGNSYTVESRPETTERKEKAIEAVAVAKNGKRLAIEHTKIQPFEGQKADDVPFLTVFEQLETDTSFRIKDTLIEIYVRAGAVPKGIVWKELAPKVREWFAKARESFPPEGQVSHDIPDLGFTLTVCVQTMQIPGTDGLVNIGRILPFGNSFIDVLRKALANKVPKLVGTPADTHILLLVLILQRTHWNKYSNPAARNGQGLVSFDLKKGCLKKREIPPVADERFDKRVLNGKGFVIGFSFRNPIYSLAALVLLVRLVMYAVCP